MSKRFIALSGAVLGLISLMAVASPHTAEARSYRTRASDVRVGGYYRSNGTYVQSYYRSKADSSRFNNYGCLDYGRCR